MYVQLKAEVEKTIPNLQTPNPPSRCPSLLQTKLVKKYMCPSVGKDANSQFMFYLRGEIIKRN